MKNRVDFNRQSDNIFEKYWTLLLRFEIMLQVGWLDVAKYRECYISPAILGSYFSTELACMRRLHYVKSILIVALFKRSNLIVAHTFMLKIIARIE